MDAIEDKALLQFPVLYEAWDCDSTGWVMERPDGARYLKLTNHGSPYEADPTALEERIQEYINVIAATRQAQALLTIPQH